MQGWRKVGALGALLLALLLCGCWNRHELSELSLVVGMAIDKAEDGYRIAVQVVNPGQVVAQKGAGVSSTVVLFEEEGKTLPEALGRMTTRTPYPLYFAHLRMVILSEEVARAGIAKPLDYLSRNNEMRNDFYFAVARNSTAAEVLKITSPIESIPANSLYTKLETSDQVWAATGKITLLELTQDLATEGRNPTLTGIRVVGNKSAGDSMSNRQYIDPPVELVYDGMAVFHGDRMVGWLTEMDTKIMNYVRNRVKKTTAIQPCPNPEEGTVTLRVERSHANIDVKLTDGEPVFLIDVRLEQDIADMECAMDLSKLDTLYQVEKVSNERLDALLKSSIAGVQRRFGSDIYGLGKKLHSKFPREWASIDDWNETFRNVRIDVRGTAILRRIGTTLQPIDYRTRE
ncbi:Ger(x)C family spore germination protein [Paenibacillus sp. IB182496]|uniref:Ger(X)C family spore germination protein n=1 Tax=Paenibacillus sabuli TaxID=2772509 RepID=A0A927BQ38_9BACL|nr:Ger(x)C family spore germination protein [Paenibacillus sabuli]MBD2844192.1 Ger(x)C family spore germination protein [Paenibacillus sabuli]